MAMRIKNVYDAVKDAESLIREEERKTREHNTKLLAHASNLNHDDHVKTRKQAVELAAHTTDLLGSKIDATGSALGAEIKKIGWAGKSVGWIIFELIVAACLFALGVWFFGTHCLVPVYDANWTMTGMIRDWHTWIITAGVPVIWLIVAHWLIPAGYKKSE